VVVGAIGFILLNLGFEFGRWIAACAVLLGAGALFTGWTFQLAGKLKNDLKKPDA